MKVVRLIIENFRGIKSAQLHFDGHALMVGSNNVGKSTICEALDLVLGPDRLNRFPPIDEFDFYNGNYFIPNVNAEVPPQLVTLRIEAVVIELSAEVSTKCGGHVEFWHMTEQRMLGPGEADAANPPLVVPCLRLETVGRYIKARMNLKRKLIFLTAPMRLTESYLRFPGQSSAFLASFIFALCAQDRER